MTDDPTSDDGLRLGVSICIFRGGEVLLVERGKPPGVGRWAPVGGGIEPGETAEAAARREVAEETGVTIELLGRVGTREIRPSAADGGAVRLVRLEVFAARWIAGEPVAGDDAAEATFVALERLADVDLMPGVEPWIRRARRLFDGGTA